MNTECARKLIVLLENVRRRPGMYFPIDQSGVDGFLGGFHAMCLTLFDEEHNPTLTHAILRERGWSPTNALAPWPEMEQRGFDIHAMIDEVLTIEIDVLRRHYNV